MEKLSETVNEIRSLLFENKVDFEDSFDEFSDEEKGKIVKTQKALVTFENEHGSSLVGIDRGKIHYYVLNKGLVNWAMQEGFSEKEIGTKLKTWIPVDNIRFIKYMKGERVKFDEKI